MGDMPIVVESEPLFLGRTSHNFTLTTLCVGGVRGGASVAMAMPGIGKAVGEVPWRLSGCGTMEPPIACQQLVLCFRRIIHCNPLWALSGWVGFGGVRRSGRYAIPVLVSWDVVRKRLRGRGSSEGISIC